MFLELLQRGVRTAYRTLGGLEMVHETDRARVHSFLFESRHEHTVVLLHGLGDASTTWYHVVNRLRGTCNILAIDLPPYGLSKLHEEPFLHPEQQAMEVVPVIKKFAGSDVTVLGQSMGGWVLQWMMYRAPEVADRCVLVSPAGAVLEGTLEALDYMSPHDEHDVLALWDRMWYERPTIAPFIARSALARFHQPEFRGFLYSLDLPDFLTDEMYAHIEVPALVVWGIDDGILDPDTPGWLAERWGALTDRTYLARCAHLPHIERPEALVHRVVSFVEQHE